MKFAIDAHGGDNAPAAVIEGTLEAMNRNDDFCVIFCGDENTIKALLAEHKYDAARVSISHAPDIITCEESPTSAVSHKPDSSLVRGLNLVAAKEADCFISAGSTGAVLAGAIFKVKRVPGIKRPALAPILPTLQGPVILIDCGANVDCKPEFLVQFAQMGSAYMSGVFGIKAPRVALINNGAEETKGNELTKTAYQLLKDVPGINFVGNCEPRDIMSGDYDVLVCDGFVGNTVLKSHEGAANAIMKMLKTEIMSKKRSKIGALLCRNAFRTLKHKMDYKEYGGAPLLGVNGGVIKAHGSSDAHAFCSAIMQARALVSGSVTEKITEAACTAQQN